MKRSVLFVVISFVLTSIWFGPGKMLAHAEEGLPFYNPFHTFQMYSHMWQDDGLGFVNLFSIPRIVVSAFVNLLHENEVPAVKAQQLIYFLLILIALFSVFLLCGSLLPEMPRITGFFASFLYVFNLFFLTQVLQRFIFELFFLWSYLPLFLFLWYSWLSTRKLKYLILFLVSNFFYSSIYVIIASIFALWVPAVILWTRDHKLFPALIAGGLWLTSTMWWSYPLATTKDNPFSQFLGSPQNIVSLVDVSKYFPSSEIMLLKQKYFFASETIWYKYFSAKPIISISWMLLAFLVLGLFVSVRLKNGKLLILWLIVGWFLVKGANPPFGLEFYSWLFKYFPFTVVLRNSYEKLGVVFLLPYCLLVAVGLTKISFRMIRIIVLFIICFVLIRPLWTGQVIAGFQVDVPQSYSQANAYLNSLSNLRILHLPFLQGSGVSYSWGYSGDEPSNFLFDRPSLSKTYFNRGDPYLLIGKYLHSSQVYRILQLFGIDAIVLHKDLLVIPELLGNYNDNKSLLNHMAKLTPGKSFENLDTYLLNKNLGISWGYLSNRVFQVPTFESGIELVANDNSFALNQDSFVVSSLPPKIPYNKLPKYTLTKLSSIRYRFNIKNAIDPYILVLGINYNENWKAVTNQGLISNHFPINGFANGWLIDQKGDYVVDVKFKTWPWE